MTHPVKVSADLFGELREEADRDGLTIQAALQRRLDESERRIRDLAASHTESEAQLEKLRARLEGVGRESVKDGERLAQLQQEETRLREALYEATDERDELAGALHDTRDESSQLSRELARTKEESTRFRENLKTIAVVVVVGGLIALGGIWLKRFLDKKQQADPERPASPAMPTWTL